jgi:hypothetical protein
MLPGGPDDNPISTRFLASVECLKIPAQASGQIFNPILHTAWLNNHALTLKRNTAKYYFGENPVFCIPSQKLLLIKENLSQTQRLFNFNAISLLKKSKS